jgi:hypothetical protein
MTTAADLQADLDRVNLAISRIEESLTQSHTVGGDQVVSPSLDAMYRERARLREELAMATAGSASVRRVRVVH